MISPRRGYAVGAFLTLSLLVSRTARAQTSDNVLLVVNDASPASVQIGDYYRRKRAVADDHVVRVSVPVADTIQRSDYLLTIEDPIAKALSKNRLQDRVLYMVLTKGVPLRIAGTSGLNGTLASVDSELTLLYRKLTGAPASAMGRVQNPLFLGDKPVTEAQPITRFTTDIYLVTRLDGFTVDDVLKLIDRASAPATDGKIVLDKKSTFTDAGGDKWLEQAAQRLSATGAAGRVVLESTTAAASAAGPVLGYYSWGSNDPAHQLRRFGLTFANGAIAGMFVSTDGRTFNEPPENWMPSNPNGGPVFGGSFQSLAGDLIRDGVTGVSAHVDEPYLDATIRPQILFPAYLSGFNLAEAYYLAMPFLSWQTVIIGDPLCAPFRQRPSSPDAIAKGIDADTELPALLSERRLALLARTGLNLDALKITLKVETHLARGDRSDYESLLLRAYALEPRLNALPLAALYEQDGQFEKAIGVYRRVVAAEPRNATALNNLAYALAERQHQPQQALPFAEQAYALAPSPTIADTVGWIHHLLGNDRTAEPFLTRAAAGAPGDVDLLVHAATVHAALGSLVQAKAELDAALKLDPRIAERADVKALRIRVGGGNT